MDTASSFRIFTLGDLARHFRCETWQVQRLFNVGRLTANRAGNLRVVTEDRLDQVETALREAGYLS